MKNNIHWGNYYFSQMAGPVDNIPYKFNNYSLNQNKIISSLEHWGKNTHITYVITQKHDKVVVD